MILLGGIRSERPMTMLTDALDELGAPYRLFNQRRCAECEIGARGLGSRSGRCAGPPRRDLPIEGYFGDLFPLDGRPHSTRAGGRAPRFAGAPA